MKFANYTFFARGVNNLGDNMQLIAVDYIYKFMNLSKEDIVYIDKNELSSYNGEYVILPVTMPLIDYTENGICGRFSEHILPVFFGLTLVTEYLLTQEIVYYHKYEPIGCRDERTLNTMRKYGIQSYLNGCITATLPIRENKETQKKVFIVDVPDELIPHIPAEIRNEAVYYTHMHNNLCENPKELMKKYYETYKNEARLIVTSLLHCSVPCMAAGIPVVMAKTHISYRFAWLEKLLKLYDEDDFDKIDWNPTPVIYEEHKNRLLNLTVRRLREAYDKYSEIADISYFYEMRDKKTYYVDAFASIKQFIDHTFTDKEKIYKYSIWGLTQISSHAVRYIEEKYPNAELINVYDTFRELTFEGKRSQSPENIRKNQEDYILVTTNGAKNNALKLFNELGKDRSSYAFFEPVR